MSNTMTSLFSKQTNTSNEEASALLSYQKQKESAEDEDGHHIDNSSRGDPGSPRTRLVASLSLTLLLLMALVGVRHQSNTDYLRVSLLPVLGSTAEPCETTFVNEVNVKRHMCAGATLSKTSFCEVGFTPVDPICGCSAGAGTKKPRNSSPELSQKYVGSDFVKGITCSCKNTGTICKKLTSTVKMTCSSDEMCFPSKTKVVEPGEAVQWTQIGSLSNPTTNPVDLTIVESTGFSVTDGASHSNTITQVSTIDMSLGLEVGNDSTLYKVTASMTSSKSKGSETSTESFSETTIYSSKDTTLHFDVPPMEKRVVWQLSAPMGGATFFFPHLAVTDGSKPVATEEDHISELTVTYSSG